MRTPGMTNLDVFARIAVANRNDGGESLMALHRGEEGDPNDTIYQQARNFITTRCVSLEADGQPAEKNQVRSQLLMENKDLLDPRMLELAS